MRLALLAGLSLMTISGPNLDADDSPVSQEMLLTSFDQSSADFGWFVVNDNVMGGRSQGGFLLEDDELRFSGSTNTRGGGFSSIRTSPMRLDLSAYDGVRLRIKGDGRRYTWRLTTDAVRRGRQVSYWADFESRDGEWHIVDVPFSRFIPRFRGFQLDCPALDASQVTGMGLMIYDKRDGPFELRLASVSAYASGR